MRDREVQLEFDGHFSGQRLIPEARSREPGNLEAATLVGRDEAHTQGARAVHEQRKRDCPCAEPAVQEIGSGNGRAPAREHGAVEEWGCGLCVCLAL